MGTVPAMIRLRNPGPCSSIAMAPPMGEMRAHACAMRVPQAFTACPRIHGVSAISPCSSRTAVTSARIVWMLALLKAFRSACAKAPPHPMRRTAG
eukprot:16017767-Heterocapsa_arctica.AAC.1